MDEHTDRVNALSLESSENEGRALSAALSVHYIILVIYFFGTLLCAASIFISFMSKTGIDAGLAIASSLPALLFSLHLLAVKGLKRMKPWGYNTSRVLAFLLLLAFPFGTVLGVILLSQLNKFRFAG